MHVNAATAQRLVHVLKLVRFLVSLRRSIDVPGSSFLIVIIIIIPSTLGFTYTFFIFLDCSFQY